MRFGELKEGDVSRAVAGKSSRKWGSTTSGRLALMSTELGIPDSNSWQEFLLGLGWAATRGWYQRKGSENPQGSGSRIPWVAMERKECHSQPGFGDAAQQRLARDSEVLISVMALIAAKRSNPSSFIIPVFPCRISLGLVAVKPEEELIFWVNTAEFSWAQKQSHSLCQTRGWIVSFILVLVSLQSSFIPLDYLETALKVLLNKLLFSEKRTTFSEEGRCIFGWFQQSDWSWQLSYEARVSFFRHYTATKRLPLEEEVSVTNGYSNTVVRIVLLSVDCSKILFWLFSK